MQTRLKIAALLLLAAPLGCSHAEMSLAERDLRAQENRIYDLQQYVHEYQHMLETCQAENAELRRQLEERGQSPATAPQPPRKPRTLRDVLRGDAGTPPDVDGPALTPPAAPSIDLGIPVDPSQILPDSPSPPATTPAPASGGAESEAKPPGSTAPPLAPTPPGFTPPSKDELPEPDAPAAPTAAAHSLFIRSVGPTRGDASTPGGLLVVIEPRSTSGGLARAPAGATMSLMIVGGPTDETLGRWDYSAAETALAYRSGFGAASGWRFVVPFERKPNTPLRLKIYARLVTSDGEKLLAEREFDSENGASIEELPAGNAGWSRPRTRLLARLAGPLQELRTNLSPGERRGGAAAPARSHSNTAPAWSPRETPVPTTPPRVSITPGIPTSPIAPPAAPEAGRIWDKAEVSAAPLTSAAGATGAAPTAEPAAQTARPIWSPYR